MGCGGWVGVGGRGLWGRTWACGEPAWRRLLLWPACRGSIALELDTGGEKNKDIYTKIETHTHVHKNYDFNFMLWLYYFSFNIKRFYLYHFLFTDFQGRPQNFLFIRETHSFISIFQHSKDTDEKFGNRTKYGCCGF